MSMLSKAYNNIYRILFLPSILAIALILINQFLPLRGFYKDIKYPLALTWGSLAILVLFNILVYFYWRKRFSLARMTYLSDVAFVGLAMLIVYELFTNRLDLVVSPIFPSLNSIFYAFWGDAYLLLWKCTLASLALALTGYFFGVVIGIGLGIILGWSKRLLAVINPYLRITNAVPLPAWIPMLIILLPTFFISMSALLFIGTFFNVLNSTMFGIVNVDRRFVEAAEMLGAREKQILFNVAIPSALPNIFAGLLAGWVVMFMLLIIAEMIGASVGIGWYLMFTRGWGEYDKVIAAMVWAGGLGLAGFEAIKLVERRMLRWRVGIVR